MCVTASVTRSTKSINFPSVEALKHVKRFQYHLKTIKTSAAIIQQLNREIVRVLHKADIKALFLNAGIEAVGSTPEAFAAAIKADVARMSKVINEAGIRED